MLDHNAFHGTLPDGLCSSMTALKVSTTEMSLGQLSSQCVSGTSLLRMAMGNVHSTSL